MKLINSFKYAVAGFFYCIKHERNFRIHLISAVAVIGFAIFLELSAYEIIAIIFAIALVLICEMFNTSIERIVDNLTDAHNENAKIAKDVAAGAVLISAIFAAVVGIVIFGGRLL